MRQIAALGLVLALAAGAGLAETAAPRTQGESAGTDTPLTAAQFDALTQGTTMDTFDVTLGLYGVETYLPGQRVVWKDSNGCTNGTWKQVDDHICFTYDADPATPVCWAYFDRGDKIAGWLDGDPGLMSIELIDKGSAPVSCGEYLGA